MSKLVLKSASNSIVSSARNNHRLVQFLASPGKVAHMLDWKKTSGSILTLSISKRKIDMAIAFHPSNYEPIHMLPSIPVHTSIADGNTNNSKKNKRRIVLAQDVVDKLAQTLQKFDNVCGLLVNWPLEKEGWCGAGCGRVIYTLDQIIALQQQQQQQQLQIRSSTSDTTTALSIINEKRPVCLWDHEHHVPPEDSFGRSKLYSTVSYSNTYVSSEEASLQQQKQQELFDNGRKNPANIPVQVWNDFCKVHWPHLYEDYLYHQQQRPESLLDDNVIDLSSSWGEDVPFQRATIG